MVIIQCLKILFPKVIAKSGVEQTPRIACRWIQDHEKAIQAELCKQKFKEEKIKLDTDFPVASPDLNVYTIFS